ncbi:MAG TPA: hypothetical protein VJ020_03270 [Anaerolineales bacterium]|nr:hypothetical protein [Anaerolineales bacterium]
MAANGEAGGKGLVAHGVIVIMTNLGGGKAIAVGAGLDVIPHATITKLAYIMARHAFRKWCMLESTVVDNAERPTFRFSGLAGGWAEKSDVEEGSLPRSRSLTATAPTMLTATWHWCMVIAMI